MGHSFGRVPVLKGVVGRVVYRIHKHNDEWSLTKITILCELGEWNTLNELYLNSEVLYV